MQPIPFPGVVSGIVRGPAFLRAWVAMRHAVIAPMLILGLTLAGCYDTQHEVFGPKEGVIVAGLDGQYALRHPDGVVDHFIVFWAQRGTDYRLIEQHQGFQTFGTFRAVPLGTNLYVVQLSYDTGWTGSRRLRPEDAVERTVKVEPDIFAQTFFRVTRSGGVIVKLDELVPDTGAAWAISQRDGIEMWDQYKGAAGLSGPHAALGRFLRDLGAVPFMVIGTYWRTPKGGQ